MSPLAIGVLALTMSVDATVASLGRGAGLRGARLRQALQTGLVFGVVETITPLIGWLAGITASRIIETWDHWIAFVLLAIVGGHMIHAALKPHEEAGPARLASSPLVLVMTAVGTSIDAMIVGVSLAFLEVNILIVAAAIGTATFVMSTLGVLAGRMVGGRVGRMAGVLGGLALIGLGLWILSQHLWPGPSP